MAFSLRHELDATMSEVASQLTSAVDHVLIAQQTLDHVISVVGSATDAAGAKSISLLESGPSPMAVATARSVVLSQLDAFVKKVFAQITDALVAFRDKIEPALTQIGQWVVTFGDRLQAGIEGFSTTIDRVQKMFDKMMERMASSGGNAEYMEHSTFNLFDADFSGGLSLDDLRFASQAYAITALEGTKSEELHAKYDADDSGELDRREFSLFVHDSSLPNIMAVVLRSYARALSQLGAHVGAARMRDEVATSVAEYLAAVSAKNRTQVSWVCEGLTNGSVPLAFTAGVIGSLAAAGVPGPLGAEVPGAIALGEMARLNASHLHAAVELLSEASFFEDEGLDLLDQPAVVARSVAWASAGEGAALLQRSAEARARVERALVQRLEAKRRARGTRASVLMRSYTARLLFEALLGGATAAGDDPSAERAVRSGVQALPETLVFAGWLAANVSRDAAEFHKASFDYSGQLSSPTDALATQIHGMVKEVQVFLNAMSVLSSEKGIMRIRDRVHDFTEKGEVALQQLVKNQIDHTFDSLLGGAALTMGAIGSLSPSNRSSLETHRATTSLDDPQSAIIVSWGQLQELLSSVQGVLPTCIKSLKSARRGVSALSATLDSSFEVLGHGAPSVFETAAWSYAAMWILYYLLLSLFALALLCYAFWASGFLGQASHADGLDRYEPPSTLVERLRTLGASSCHGLVGRCSGEVCFWSFLLAAQLGVLLLFLVTLILCILAGVNAFVASGCAELYILGDAGVCTDALGMLRAWLTTFGIPGSEDIDNVCVERNLLTCQHLGPRMKPAAMLTCVGGLLGAVFSFLIVVDSAVLHERVRMRQLVKALTVSKDGGSPRLADCVA